MKGYKAILDARLSGADIAHVFVYVDAMPYRLKDGKPIKDYGAGVVFIEPDDEPEGTFTAFYGLKIFLIGGNKSRVMPFAERIIQFKPKQIVADYGDEMEIFE